MRQVHHVLQAVAVGLGHDGEVVEVAHDLQQVPGAQPLQPEGRALAAAAGPAAAARAPRSGGSARRRPPSRAVPAGCARGPRPAPSRSPGRAGTRRRPSGKTRSRMPSSLVCTSTSTPVRSRSAPASASPHGPLTRPPKGEWITSRGSPSASSKTSTRIVRSDEMAPVMVELAGHVVHHDARPSAHPARSPRRSQASRSCTAAAVALVPRCSAKSVQAQLLPQLLQPLGHRRAGTRPPARPARRAARDSHRARRASAAWRPARRRPSTRSSVMSITRQTWEPSMKVSPTRVSKTNSSSSSPSLVLPSLR